MYAEEVMFSPRRRVILTIRLRRCVKATPGLAHVATSVMRAYRSQRPDHASPERLKSLDYDRMTVEVARGTLTGSGVCVDIGANVGALLHKFIRVSPTSRFIAVEPIPGLAKHIRHRWPAVLVHQVALSDKAGAATFRYLPDQPAVSSLYVRGHVEGGERVKELQVVVETLDRIVGDAGPVEFVKIDVEGAEMEVLRGARNLLWRDRPVLVIESGGDENLRSVERCLAASNYGMWSMPSWLSRRPMIEDVDELLQLHSDGEYQFVAAPRDGVRRIEDLGGASTS